MNMSHPTKKTAPSQRNGIEVEFCTKAGNGIFCVFAVHVSLALIVLKKQNRVVFALFGTERLAFDSNHRIVEFQFQMISEIEKSIFWNGFVRLAAAIQRNRSRIVMPTNGTGLRVYLWPGSVYFIELSCCVCGWLGSELPVHSVPNPKKYPTNYLIRMEDRWTNEFHFDKINIRHPYLIEMRSVRPTTSYGLEKAARSSIRYQRAASI